MQARKIIIIGAGPAGLTAAYELYQEGERDITVLEASADFGGLSKTVKHHGNRIDIGGHRFFSKSDWVMQWWLARLPLAGIDEPHSLKPESGHAFLGYQGKTRALPLGANDETPGSGDAVMLIRDRLSRILFAGKFFDYPLKLNFDTATKLGLGRMAKFGLSYVRARLFPRKPEATLEDFFINRFGELLYRQFFKDYSEKVWGRSCAQISAEWGAQRVKSLSISKALLHALRQPFRSRADMQAEQTSLIEHFLYPKFGPGQMWESVADELAQKGVHLVMNTKVVGLELAAGQGITAVTTEDSQSGERCHLTADVFISTMPVRDLVNGMAGPVPDHVRSIADELEYRDFITVGLLYDKLKPDQERSIAGRSSIPDNWIYVQEPGVHVGRLQIFNNWSPYMVQNANQAWVGLEFFCRESDDLWNMSDADLIALSRQEMQQIGLAEAQDQRDGVVVRMPKAYPGYYGAYEHFDTVRAFLDSIPNLYLIGRNGMHRYNNQDHSMLSARAAVDAIMAGSADKSAIWAINIDDDYHEEVDAK